MVPPLRREKPARVDHREQVFTIPGRPAGAGAPLDTTPLPRIALSRRWRRVEMPRLGAAIEKLKSRARPGDVNRSFPLMLSPFILFVCSL